MIRYVFSLIVISCVASSSVFAQIPNRRTSDTTSLHPDSATRAILSASSAGHIMWHDIKEAVYDGGQYVTRPLHWNAREWAITGTVLGFTGVISIADDRLARDFFQRNQSSLGDNLVKFGNNFYGNGIATVLAGGSLYTIGLASDNNKLRVMGRHIFQSFAYAGITTTTLKILLGRDRPFLNQGSVIYHGFSFDNIWNSMPSGHVTVAAALSETLASDIGNPWATAGLYTALGATMVGRMYSDQHWLSDTFLGALIGTAAGYWVSQEEDHYDMQTNEPKEASLLIEPTGLGLGLTYRF